MKKSKFFKVKVTENSHSYGKVLKIGYYQSLSDIIRFNADYTDEQIFVKVYGGNYEPLWVYTTYYI